MLNIESQNLNSNLNLLLFSQIKLSPLLGFELRFPDSEADDMPVRHRASLLGYFKVIIWFGLSYCQFRFCGFVEQLKKFSHTILFFQSSGFGRPTLPEASNNNIARNGRKKVKQCIQF